VLLANRLSALMTQAEERLKELTSVPTQPYARLLTNFACEEVNRPPDCGG